MRSLLVLLLLGGVAVADQTAAKAAYKKGLSQFALGKYTEAAASYEAAFDAEPDPALLYNAAQAHRLAGNKPRALLLYQNYLRLFPNPVNRGEVLRHIAGLAAAVEADQRLITSPPTVPLRPEPVTAPPQVVVVAKPEPRKRTPVWIWGVAGGGVAIALGLGLGLGLGLSSPHYLVANGGEVKLQ